MLIALIGLIGFLALSGLFAMFADYRANRLYPPTGKFVTVAGVSLHYREEGAGPGVILLHGNGGLIADMETSTLVRRLARSHRVIAFDRPGFGYSDLPQGICMTPEAQAQLFIAAAKTLSLTSPVIVGHSYGALVAISWGLEAPDTVTGLLLVSSYCAPDYRPLAMLKAIKMPIVGSLLKWCVVPIMARVLLPFIVKASFSPTTPTQPFRRQIPWALVLRSNQLTATLEEASEMPRSAARISQRCQELGVRVVLLAGTDDMIVNTRIHTCSLKRLLPRCDMHLVAGVGHMFHHARPEIVCDAVSRLTDATSRAAA